MRTDQVKNYLAGKYFAADPVYLDEVLATINAGIPKLETDSTFQDNHGYTLMGDVAVIVADGATIKKNSWINAMCGGFVGYDTIAGYIERADKEASKTLIIADTRGGEVAGVDELQFTLKNAKNETYVLYENIGASAGVWWGSAADHLYATETTFIGSIGVMAAYQEPADDGRIVRVSKNAENKNCSITGDCKKRVDEEINALEDTFITRVSDNTSIEREPLIALFNNGGVIPAKAALDGGFIEGITTRAELLATLGASPTATKRQKQTNTQGVNMSQTHEEQIAALESTIESKDAEIAGLNEKLAALETEKTEALDEQSKVVAHAFDRIAKHSIEPTLAKELLGMDSIAAVNEKVLANIESDGATTEGHTDDGTEKSYGWDDYDKETK